MFYVFLMDDDSVQVWPAAAVVATYFDFAWSFTEVGVNWVAVYSSGTLAGAVSGANALAANPDAPGGTLTLIAEQPEAP